MADPLQPRDRLRDLNTKAYYLLVALSFLYVRRGSAATIFLKLALTLTALVAVAPVQDFTNSDPWLWRMRVGKIVCLWLALVFALLWVWAPAS